VFNESIKTEMDWTLKTYKDGGEEREKEEKKKALLASSSPIALLLMLASPLFSSLVRKSSKFIDF